MDWEEASKFSQALENHEASQDSSTTPPLQLQLRTTRSPGHPGGATVQPRFPFLLEGRMMGRQADEGQRMLYGHPIMTYPSEHVSYSAGPSSQSFRLDTRLLTADQATTQIVSDRPEARQGRSLELPPRGMARLFPSRSAGWPARITVPEIFRWSPSPRLMQELFELLKSKLGLKLEQDMTLLPAGHMLEFDREYSSDDVFAVRNAAYGFKLPSQRVLAKISKPPKLGYETSMPIIILIWTIETEDGKELLQLRGAVGGSNTLERRIRTWKAGASYVVNRHRDYVKFLACTDDSSRR